MRWPVNCCRARKDFISGWQCDGPLIAVKQAKRTMVRRGEEWGGI
jgi:hypothetical protein